MRIARRKLQSENPVCIIIDELRTGNSGRKPWFEMMKAGCEGSEGSRKKVGAFCKDWSQQIDLLVELSTDPGLLGRSWIGWAPWC
jgi:DNA-dependent protein kinase catalytic subunit